MVEINWGIQDAKTLKFWRAILAECFGMIIFLLSVSLVAQPWNLDTHTVEIGNRSVTTKIPVDPSANHVEIGLGIGLSITTAAVMIGHISGGHLNPAVTLGCIFAGRISVFQGLFYIPAQMVGGIVGSGIAYGLTPKHMRDISNLGAVGLGKGVTPAQGFGLELMFTMVLVFFVLSITDSKKKVETYAVPLSIGVCIVVCHLFLVPMTGCGINPARAFAPAVIMKGQWDNQWCYWVGPIVGALLASVLYKLLFFHDDDE
jgi:MIP family channel proteins